MDLDANSPVFDQLLRLNPWAADLWDRRKALIKDHRWNVNAINQAGNSETREWLADFFPLRSAATLERLEGSITAHNDWARDIGRLAIDVLSSKPVADAFVGTPMTPTTNGALANFDAKVSGYAPGQFKADFLLLTQESLRGLTLTKEFDMSGRTFPIGLDLVSTTFQGALRANDTRFGPFSDHSSAIFTSADFANAHFADQAHFTITRFDGDTNFSNTVFSGPASFHATYFGGAANFSGCRFEYSTGFCGAVFEKVANFASATFEEDTTFEDSMFHQSASFQKASFKGQVYTGRIPKDVKQGILEAEHPNR